MLVMGWATTPLKYSDYNVRNTIPACCWKIENVDRVLNSKEPFANKSVDVLKSSRKEEYPLRYRREFPREKSPLVVAF
ncbi:hypothetical protein KPH14_007110 [Odynerus spinipes]|uniref:Uncharacterized protein n=1 Tax=Odynerus spinipes TaxID=1348599 RepID=A0AAD9VST2_9HYME|nr:hypothetical protein KPH14_007110 [Odynerus spinipes]